MGEGSGSKLPAVQTQRPDFGFPASIKSKQTDRQRQKQNKMEKRNKKQKTEQVLEFGSITPTLREQRGTDPWSSLTCQPSQNDDFRYRETPCLKNSEGESA